MDCTSRCSAHELCHSLSEASSHTVNPGALHLSWGGWDLHAKIRCGSLGRTCPWALMLRVKGIRQEKTPMSKPKSRARQFFQVRSRTWRSQIQGESDVSRKTRRNSLSQENTSKVRLLKDRIRRIDRMGQNRIGEYYIRAWIVSGNIHFSYVYVWVLGCNVKSTSYWGILVKEKRLWSPTAVCCAWKVAWVYSSTEWVPANSMSPRSDQVSPAEHYL